MRKRGTTGQIEILESGISSTVQDQGRPGLAHLGIPPSGAVDPALAALVNRLVGNDDDAAVIETYGKLRVRALSPTLVADSFTLVPTILHPGGQHLVETSGERMWQYFAVRGGIIVDPVLGSRSRDTMSGIGPPLPTRGMRLVVGPNPRRPVAIDVAPLPGLPHVATVTPGPRTGWFAPTWARAVAEATWTVTSSNRVGVRLSADVAIERVREGEVPSEGLVRGAIRVPPDGHPIMMLADYPTTGGDPVIAVVEPDDVVVVAQHPPGASFRMRLV